jgi:hypothetical protein
MSTNKYLPTLEGSYCLHLQSVSSANVRNFGNLLLSISCDIPEDFSLLYLYKETDRNNGTRKHLERFILLNPYPANVENGVSS